MHVSEVMRSYIIDMETIGIAEQAGRFCESLKENLSDTGIFEGTQFTYSSDEPYEAHFIWDKGDTRIQLSFMGDPDDSVWSIVCGKRRVKGLIGSDPEGSCKRFVDTLQQLL